jgi:hypothetical protein
VSSVRTMRLGTPNDCGCPQVEVAVHPEQPTHRIVHLRDWHFVPRDLYALNNPDGS